MQRQAAMPSNWHTKHNTRAGAPRLLCDEMLKGLARWLRAAGYDTRVGPDGSPDRRLLSLAHAEGRWLITRDTGLVEHRGAVGTVLVLESNGVDACAREIAGQLAIDWLHAPFSRCLRCNTPLQACPPSRARQLAALKRTAALRHCPDCDRVYWNGSHVRRMRQQLASWQRVASAP